MAGITNISGLASGIDWSSMITQLMAVEHKRVDLVSDKKTDAENKLSEWQSFNARLTTLQSASAALKNPDGFRVYVSAMTTDSSTVKGNDLLSVAAGETASPGTYSIRITNLAQAQKLSSNPFTSASSALGSDYAGDLLINGRVVTVSTSDTLSDVAQRINTANTGTNPSGVTASIVKYGGNDYRLILTSDKTGADGISLLNGGTSGLVQRFGWKDGQTAALKNSITLGAQGDRLSSSSTTIQALLGLTAGESGSVTIGDKSVAIDLAAMSLTDIKNAINSAAPTGVTASIVSETEGGKSYYRLQIDGTQTFSDTKNILNTLGVLDHTSADVSGNISGNALTVNGAKITASSVLKNIDGYNTFATGDYVTLSGTSASGAAVNTNLTITSATTVQDLLDEIETRFGNVLAYVTSDGKIRVDDLSGGSSLAVNLTDHIQAAGSSLEFTAGDANFSAATARKREIISGEDAAVEIDGVTITSAENTVTDAITGVTLDLLKEDAGTTISLSVQHDTDTVKNNIQDFVDAYNDVLSYINGQFTYDAEKKATGGILFADGTLSSIKTDLSTAIIQQVAGVNSEFSILGLVGITMDNNAILSVDDSKLSGYLRTNFNDVVSLFSGQGTTSVSSLSYISHGYDAKAGSYAVHISNAAARSNATSSTAVSGTLGAGETLTVTEGSKTAAIVLTSGMSIGDIVNAVNDEMGKVYTETLAGSESLYADAGQSAAITASTAWSSVYDGSGNPAGIVDGDSISFDVTTRTGDTLSGTYVINDADADTVQGLLSAIQQTFGNTVNATINSAGRLIVTDKTTGNSALSVTLDTSQAHNLSFGTLSASNAGGAEGRYALDIDASADESGHLVLTHGTYGSAYTFTISETSDLLWSGDQTVNNGEDVAGTINGEAATGSGQVLTGNSGEANIDGLVIKYTGSAENVDVGTVNLTFGTAELFDRTLNSILDTTSGYLTFKLQSLQNSIDGYETRVSEMEALLELEKERLTKQYTAMETAMSKLQQQSNWLAGQLSAASSAWK